MARFESLIRVQAAGTLELAELVSFAVRVEPMLLRRARLELLSPEVDAGAEADVWMSPLVQSRSPEGIVFHPEVSAILRENLHKRPDNRFQKAWNLVRDFHKHLPETIRFEEEIAYLSADPNTHVLATIDDKLRQATATLVAESSGQSLAGWAVRALPLLPPRVRGLEGSRMLAAASYLRLGRHLPVSERHGAIPDWLGWLLPSNLPNTWVRLRLVADGVELIPGERSEPSVPVPDTRPCVVELSWKEGDDERVEQVMLQPGERRLIRTTAGEIIVRTVLGERYQLTRSEPKPTEEAQMEQAPKRHTCFVIMGFGRKTDFQTGRVLDLDQTYRNIIKPAMEAAGLTCTRADEIPHSGLIDVPMFEQLLGADVVIADISTWHFNTAYELGVRHALRPQSTFVIAESEMRCPFDLNELPIRFYRHLGEGIGYDEVMRFRGELTNAVRSILDNPEPDSPVYRFLPQLKPPMLGGVSKLPAMESNAAAERQGASIRALLEQADKAIAESDFRTAKVLLTQARGLAPSDASVIQKLALATYRSKEPDAIGALNEARSLLQKELSPENTHDTETLGLWGAVHRRLYDRTSDRNSLDAAIRAYEKAFLLKNDYYNGIT